jgi:hypothetical protein
MLENEFSSLETRKETTLVVHITLFPKRGSPGLSASIDAYAYD